MKVDYKRLKDCCTKIGSGATPKGGSSVYIDSGVSLIRSQNVYNLNFSYSGLAHINDEAATTEVQKTAVRLFGEENVVKSRTPSLSGDDFAESTSFKLMVLRIIT